MKGVGHEASGYRTERAQPRAAALAELAAKQHGVVSLAQLRAAGWSASAVRGRVAAGHLHRIHRGVYAVGHAHLDEHAHWMAAVLAYGRGALLSHRSAAALWGLLADARNRVDVTVPGRSARSRPGVVAHRATLRPGEAASAEGIPCTCVGRTLLDVASTVPRRVLERAVAQADRLRLLDVGGLDAPGHPGAGALAAAVGVEPALTASELEERFVALCGEAGLPAPEVNARVGELVVDFLWRAERLVVETDGFAFHRHAAAFERDRWRDQELALAGYRVLRFTWRQVVAEPDRVASTCISVLRRWRPQVQNSARGCASATSRPLPRRST